MSLKKNKIKHFVIWGVLLGGVLFYALNTKKNQERKLIYSVKPNQIQLTRQYKAVLRPTIVEWYNAKFVSEIVYRVDSGTVVKKGDVVLRYATDELEDEVVSHEEGIVDKEVTLEGIVLQNQSAYNMAKMDTQEAVIRVKVAQINYDLAKNDPNDLVRKEQDLLLRKDFLRKDFLESKYKSNQGLFEKGLISENALQSARVEFIRAESDYFKTNIKRQDRLAGVSQIKVKRLEKQWELAQKQEEDARIKEKNLLEIHKMDEEKIKEDIFTIGNKVKRFKRNIQNSSVHAPFDGKVFFPNIFKGGAMGEPIEVGETPIKGIGLLYFTNSSDYDVDFIVAEADLKNMKVGGKIQFVLKSNSTVTSAGEIFKISSIATDKNILLGDLALQRIGEANVKMVQVSAHLKQTHEDLRQGITGIVTIQSEGEPKLTVPLNAVIIENEKFYVMTVQNKKVEVTLGRNDNFFIEVLSGLKAGDKIVYE